MTTILRIGEKLFKTASLRCAVTQTKSDLSAYEAFLSMIRPNLESTSEIWHQSEILPAASKHSVMSIPVYYCAKALPTVPYTHQDYAALRVLSRVLSSKYLLPVVREQNGAYGAGAKISYEGLFNFFSYRDPNSVKTLEVFDSSADWLSRFPIDDQVLFEAKLGVLQQTDVPIAPVDQGMEAFRYRISRELFAQHRQQVLATTKDDLVRVSEKYLRPGKIENVGRCVLGPENPELSQFLAATK